MRRSCAALLLSPVIAGTVVLAPHPAGAQAIQLVAAIAQYVGLTAAFAEAVTRLAAAVAETYGTGRTITDDVGCRRQKAALQELVIALRDLQVRKRDLHTRLGGAVSPISDWLDWRQVRTLGLRVQIDIVELQQQIQENQQAFVGTAAVSRAYSNLLISFDAKQNLVRDLVAEMANVEWIWTRTPRRELRPQFDEIESLAQDLEVQIEVIGEATDVIADYAGTLCQPPSQ